MRDTNAALTLSTVSTDKDMATGLPMSMFISAKTNNKRNNISKYIAIILIEHFNFSN